MGVFFWDFNDYNDTGREWLCFVLNALVFIFTVLALFRSIKFHRKITNETLPLAFNLVSTLVLLMLKLFEKGYEFDLIGYLIEIFTYFLFAFTFAIILVRIRRTAQTTVRIKAYMVSLMVIITLLIVLIFLVAIKVITRTCDRNLVTVSLITLSFEILSYIPVVYNGKQILAFLSVQKQSTLTETILSKQIENKNTLSDQFTIERRKQVFTVLAIYTVSLVIRVMLLLVAVFIEDTDLVQCQELDGIFIVTSDYVLGQIVLISIEINQLLPHLIIPLAVFIVPMKSKHRKVQIGKMDEKNISSLYSDEDDDIDTRDDFITSRVSSVLSDKADSSPRRR